MTRNLFLLCGVWACLAVGRRGVADETVADLKSDVLELVDELDGPTLRQRKAAEKGLLELGAKALKFLPEQGPDLSAEAVERLGRVRQALLAEKTKRQIDQGAIRLGEVTNLGEALEEISRVSGVEFEHQADASTPVSPVAAPLSFWHALDLVLDETNQGIDFYGSDTNVLNLVRRDPDSPSRADAAAYAGVYRIEPMSVTARRVLKQPQLSSLNVSVQLSWEPRLTPIGLTVPIAELVGRLDDGELLQPQASGDTIDISTSGDLAFAEFYLPMLLPAGSPKSIESLTGTIKALLPGKRQLFELELSEIAPSEKIEAMTVTIEDVRKIGSLHAVRVGVALEDPDRSLESHRQWLFQNDVFVRLKDGSRADHFSSELYRQTGDGIGISFQFDLGESTQGATLVYQSPTSVVVNEVPFVIQGIMLP